MEPDLKDELSRVRAREQRYKSNAAARIAALEEQVEAIEAKLEREKAENIRLKEENTGLEKQLSELKTLSQEILVKNTIQTLAGLIIRYTHSLTFTQFNYSLGIWTDPAVALLEKIEKRGIPISKADVYKSICTSRSPITNEKELFDEISTVLVNMSDFDNTAQEDL